MLIRFMKKVIYFSLIPSVILIAWGFSTIHPYGKNLSFTQTDTTEIRPEEIHRKKSLLLAELIGNYHYNQHKVDDSISSATFRLYLDALDGSKLYFLQSDIQKFEKYRFQFDDLLKSGNVEPAYDIFNVYKQKMLNRIDKTLQLLDKEFEFKSDEYLETDREKVKWVVNESQLDDFWKKYVKNQLLSLKLTGKSLEEARNIVKGRYERIRKSVLQTKSEDVFQIFMNSLTGAYDPHTSYFSPVSAANFNMSMRKSFEGIGARLQTQNDYTVVSEVMPGGPAFKSKKLKANDKIIAVAQGENGKFEDVIGWRIDDVVSKIRGEKGTTVRLQIIPANSGANAAPVEIRLVRDKIKIEDESAEKKIISHTYNNKTYQLGVIQIPSFYLDFDAYQKGDKDYKSTSRDVKKLIRELQNENIDALLIDLRNNGGGSLKEAIDLTGLFIKEGPVVQVRDVAGRIDIGRDTDSEEVYEGPLLVMVNGYSASASEIFAGAIQDYKRGLIIGENTYGKGTVQNAIDLNRYAPSIQDKLGQINLTLSKYYRITGSSTQLLGITPDIKLPSAFDQEEVGERSEPQALPWDEIKSSKFTSSNKVNEALIQKLQKSYQARLKSDPNLKQLFQDLEEIKTLRKQTKISLSEEKRVKEQKEYEEKMSKRSELDIVIESEEEEEVKVENKNNKQRKDLYLLNALQVAAEMLEFTRAK